MITELLAVFASAQSAEFILNLAAQSFALLLGGWMISTLMKRASAPWRSGALLVLFLLLALWPLKMGLIPFVEERTYGILVGAPAPNLADPAQDSEDGLLVKTGGAAPPSADPMISPGATSISGRTGLWLWQTTPPLILWVNGFGAFWALGTLLFLARALYGLAYLSRLRPGLKEVTDPQVREVLTDVRAGGLVSADVELYISPEVGSPIAYGLLRPRVVLPRSLAADMGPQELRSLLVHEISHLRHHDQAAGLVQRFLTALYWWNPLIHVLSARYSMAREEVCDNHGILDNGAKAYARNLIDLAQRVDLTHRFPAATGFSSPRIPLELRIGTIISPKRKLKTHLTQPALLSLAAVSLGVAFLVGREGLALNMAGPMTADSGHALSVPLPTTGRPMALSVAHGRIYILDVGDPQSEDEPARRTEIKIFSASDFSLQGSFGKRGSGPGEFLTGPGIPQAQGDSVWSADIGKIVTFTPRGEFRGTIPFPRGFRLGGFPLLPIGDHFVTLRPDYENRQPDGSVEWNGQVYDKDLRDIRSFHSPIPSSVLYPPAPPPPPRPGQEAREPEHESPAKSAYQAIPDCIDIAVDGDRIFLADTRNGFEIFVFDETGKPVNVIRKAHAPIRVPDDFQETFMSFIRSRSAWLLDVADFRFRKEYPAFMSFKVADGKIYVATYARKDGMNELIVMNLAGDILSRSYSFPLSPDFDRDYHNFNVSKIRYDISGGKLYVLAANEGTGRYEIHVRKLE
ncbi:MAG: M56 family metallopeptidase [Candidatus Aminicenantales bacterium]